MVCIWMASWATCGSCPAAWYSATMASYSDGRMGRGKITRGSCCRSEKSRVGRCASGWCSGSASTSGSCATHRHCSAAGAWPGVCNSSPASISPRASACNCTSPVASISSNRTPGQCARKARTHCGSRPKPTVETKASRSRPTSPAAAARASAGRVWARSSRSSTCGSRAAPAGVSCTLRLVRSNSGRPSVRSSPAMAWVSGGCVMCRRCAARPKWSSSANAANCRHKRISMNGSFICHAY